MNARKITILVLVVIAIVAMATMSSGREHLLAAARWAETSPELASPVYILLFIVAVVAMFPGWVFMVAGGYLFGAIAGTMLAFVANLLGSIAAFYLARTYARQWVKQRLEGSRRFGGFDKAVERNGLFTVMFARLALLPNNLINYFCGVSAMSLRDFVIGTAIGGLPIMIINVLVGTSTKDLFTAMEEGGLVKPQVPLPLIGTIVAIMIIAIILAKRFGPRALDSTREGQAPAEPDE